MNRLNQLKEELVGGRITVYGLQQKLKIHLLDQVSSVALEVPIESGPLENEINEIDNELELIIHTLKVENQVKRALYVIGKAEMLLEKLHT